MRTNGLPGITPFRAAVVLASVLGLLPSTAAAQIHHVDLIAAELTKTVTLPNGTVVSVPMWGYALDGGVLGVIDGTDMVSVPGPRISVPPTETTLAVTLRNLLPVPTSLVVPGQPFEATPVLGPGDRVVSMTKETLPSGTQTYTFSGLKPGTFLYQSGTHQAVQVQMGLYGALTRDAAAGMAYAGVAYVNEVVLLYSEIDVALHQSVNDGTYSGLTWSGTEWTLPDPLTATGPTSTIDYAPSLYLINGQSYANDLATPPVAGGTAGQPTLLRLLNAGLKSHAPTLQNGALNIVAEDGNAYDFRRQQAALLLPAGKTHDAIWRPSAAGVYSVYDRLLGLNAEGQGAAGMLAKLAVAAAGTPPAGAPIAVGEGYSMVEGAAPLTIAPSGVLANDTNAAGGAFLYTNPSAGTVTLLPTGGFTYTPALDFFGVDSFTYRAWNGSIYSAPATVTISVAPVNDTPVAIAQSLGVKTLETLPIVLSGSDADGDALTFYLTSLPANGSLKIIDPITHVASSALTAANLYLGGTQKAFPNDGTLIYTAGAVAGTPSFTFVAKDAAPTPASAAVNIRVDAAEAAAACGGCLPLTITVTTTGGTPVTAYRWTVEEDRTFEVIPNELGLANTPSVNFHRSYMPVVQSGVAPGPPPVLDRSKRYFVSVLPTDGSYSNGGAAVAAGADSVAVTVDAGKLPTAQVRVRVFQDNAPLNASWDAVESGLAGFAVTLEDAGGRYGMSAAQQLMDAFGNPLGTTYLPCSTDTPPTIVGTCDSYEVLGYGNGFVLTDADGYALFENLVPGKFGVNVIPPAGQVWQQTTTIEGKKAIDAWVKANEPNYFAEFGPAGPHAIIGFTQAQLNSSPPVLGVGDGPFSEITGQVTNLRLSRPPDPSMYSGAPFDFTRPWVALNTGIGTAGTLLYAQPTDEDGKFRITGVPSGPYNLVVFDSALNVIIASKVLNVTGGVNLGSVGAPLKVPVMQWFSRLYNYVFEDEDEDGLRDGGEAGMPEQAINIRFRDGSMYQSAPTDRTGFVPFEEVFPFFSWLIAEVDFTRFKATGATAVVDNGGDPATAVDWRSQVGLGPDDVGAADLVPQPQSENGGAPFRTETGPVLLEAFQGFIGQSNVLLWGKAPYAPPGSISTDVNVFPFEDVDGQGDPVFPGPGDTDANGNGAFDGDQFHGGVSGIVHYSTTRAENDPRWGGAEPWEPGIPGVRVQLWDVTRNKLLNEVTADSWDDSLPTGCQGAVYQYQGSLPRDCYDGLRNWNQVRPGVFDGGYAFMSQIEPISPTPALWLTPVTGRNNAGFREVPLPAGKYVVKMIVPPGYQVVGEEDKNVDFGLEFVPQQFYLGGYPLGDGGPADPAAAPRVEDTPLAAPFCVGSLHEVPADLTLFPGVPGTYGGQMRPACDEKLVTLRNGQNPGANFFLFTEAPVAAHVTGFVLDDSANEFDPNSPQFGEKYAPPFMPIAIRDWKGREITRTSTDAYGVYNVLVPSTFTANVPAPSGMSPSMLTACVNAPTLANGTPDPHFNPKYSHSCFTLQFMPGTTSYLDTPVLPTGAFAGADQFPADVNFPNQTPVIAQVTSNAAELGSFRGPYVVDCNGGSLLLPALCPIGPGAGPSATRDAARTIVITSAGDVDVPNPYYDSLGGTQPKLVTRDYGFGSSSTNGVVRLTQRDAISGLTSSAALTVLAWSPAQITAVVPIGARTGQLTVERCLTGTGPACTNRRASVLGVTLSVADVASHLARPPKVVPAGGSIQAVIDLPSTLAGDLVLVPPGNYEQMLVMRKPVRLQGWGAPVTRLNVVQSPAENLQAWRDLVGDILALPLNQTSYLVPDQVNMLGAPPFADGILASTLGGEGAGVTVFARNLTSVLQGVMPDGQCVPVVALATQAYCVHNEGSVAAPAYRPNARIDGLSIHGSSNAAGIVVNGNARHLEISNNKIFNNYSWYAGGIKLGHPGAQLPLADEDANNRDVRIHNNQVTENAGLESVFGGSGGGGIVIGTGTSNYLVQDNWIAGNFTAGPGAGISHNGLSDMGVIDRNTIIFNESFNQGQTVSGGGISIIGRAPTAGALTPGSGSVRVSNNLIQGNQAAAGDGGAVSLAGVNGQDIADPSITDYQVVLYNNMILNNEAALAGGGIALQDAVNVEIVHNTIEHNDSLATAGAAFAPGSPQASTPQPAGIVARGHSPALAALAPSIPGSANDSFSNPRLANSIVWQNRSFYYGLVAGGVQIPGDPPSPQRYGLIAAPVTTGRVSCSMPTYVPPSALTPSTWTCWDLAVLGAPAGSALNPVSSVLTTTTRNIGGNYSTTGVTANSTTAPAFVSSYANGARNQTLVVNEANSATILAPAAFDEGGNFIRPLFGPLSLNQIDPTPTSPTDNAPVYGNRHLTAGVNGQNLNALFGGAPSVPGPLLFDFDAEPRPPLPIGGIGPHRGADQYVPSPPSPVSVSDTTLQEGNGPGTTLMTFTVSLEAPSLQSIDLRYTTTNGTAIGGVAACTPGLNLCDYVSIAANTPLPTFMPGETSKTVSVAIKGDTMYEANQTFNLVVSLAPGELDASIADGTGVGTIVNDDPIPTLSINSPAAVQEPNVTVNSATTIPINFTITLTGAHEQASSVVWSTQDGTAQVAPTILGAVTNSTDYLPVPPLPAQSGSTTASFAATTSASQTVNAAVQIRRNSASDASSETFFVNLGVAKLLSVPVPVAPTNAVISVGQGTGTITNLP